MDPQTPPSRIRFQEPPAIRRTPARERRDVRLIARRLFDDRPIVDPPKPKRYAARCA